MLKKREDAERSGPASRLLKYFVHGIALGILGYLVAYGPILLFALPFSYLSTTLPLIAYLSILFTFSILLMALLVGLVNNYLTSVLWSPMKISIKKSLVDGVAFLIGGSGLGLIYPVFFLPLVVFGTLLSLSFYYVPFGLFLLINIVSCVAMAPVFGKIGRDIAFERLEPGVLNPSCAKARNIDFISPSPHAQLIVTDITRVTRLQGEMAKLRQEQKRRKT